MRCLFHEVCDATEYIQYDVHIFIGTGWQICHPLIPGFLARYNTTCIRGPGRRMWTVEAGPLSRPGEKKYIRPAAGGPSTTSQHCPPNWIYKSEPMKLENHPAAILEYTGSRGGQEGRSSGSGVLQGRYTSKPGKHALQRKSYLCIPQKETARPQS